MPVRPSLDAPLDEVVTQVEFLTSKLFSYQIPIIQPAGIVAGQSNTTFGTVLLVA